MIKVLIALYLFIGVCVLAVAANRCPRTMGQLDARTIAVAILIWPGVVTERGSAADCGLAAAAETRPAAFGRWLSMR
jgi:hypothetical protein